MLNFILYSVSYILFFYIFMLVRGTIPRYKVTTMLSLFWRILILYSTLFLLIISTVVLI